MLSTFGTVDGGMVGGGVVVGGGMVGGGVVVGGGIVGGGGMVGTVGNVGKVIDGGGIVGGGLVDGGMVGGGIVGGGGGIVGNVGKGGKVGNVGKSCWGFSGVWAPADVSVNPIVPMPAAISAAKRRCQTCMPHLRSRTDKSRPERSTGRFGVRTGR